LVKIAASGVEALGQIGSSDTIIQLLDRLADSGTSVRKRPFEP
jgi:hypothetical protein